MQKNLRNNKNFLCSYSSNSKEPWRIDSDTPERNEKARKAYQALLTVTTKTPDNIEYLNFSNEASTNETTNASYSS